MLIERFNLPTIRMEHSIRCRTLDDNACEQLMLPRRTLGMVWDIRDFLDPRHAAAVSALSTAARPHADRDCGNQRPAQSDQPSTR
ncbi:MAG: hypothetical protein R3E68_05925 [Burkholderiaceae bacterium]